MNVQFRCFANIKVIISAQEKLVCRFDSKHLISIDDLVVRRSSSDNSVDDSIYCRVQ